MFTYYAPWLYRSSRNLAFHAHSWLHSPISYLPILTSFRFPKCHKIFPLRLEFPLTRNNNLHIYSTILDDKYGEPCFRDATGCIMFSACITVIEDLKQIFSRKTYGTCFINELKRHLMTIGYIIPTNVGDYRIPISICKRINPLACHLSISIISISIGHLQLFCKILLFIL